MAQTGQQVHDEHLRALGPELGPIYNALYNEVRWLHAKWNQCRILFALGQDRIDLLNGVAPFFFRLLQDALWEDAVLHVARLNDPPRSVGKPNLSLSMLAESVNDPVLSGEVAALVEGAKVAARFAKDWRNRHLAHRDLALALDSRATPLSEGSRKKMRLALEASAAVLNRVENHYFRSKTSFAHDVPPLGDAEELVHYLQIALEDKRRR